MDTTEFKRASQAVWDAMAPGWDNRNAYFEERARPVTERMLQRLAPAHGEAILELAAGTTAFQGRLLLARQTMYRPPIHSRTIRAALGSMRATTTLLGSRNAPIATASTAMTSVPSSTWTRDAVTLGEWAARDSEPVECHRHVERDNRGWMIAAKVTAYSAIRTSKRRGRRHRRRDGGDDCAQAELPSSRTHRAHANEWRPRAMKPNAMMPSSQRP